MAREDEASDFKPHELVVILVRKTTSAVLDTRDRAITSPSPCKEERKDLLAHAKRSGKMKKR